LAASIFYSETPDHASQVLALDNSSFGTAETILSTGLAWHQSLTTGSERKEGTEDHEEQELASVEN
jgi:hypothetical protein